MTIRRQPADFRVEERLNVQRLMDECPAEGGCALYRLTKSSMTTPEAVSRLARALGVKSGMIEYAGLKDKHALTVQHVTVRTRSGDEARRLPARADIGPGGADGSGAFASAERLGFVESPVQAGAIEANRFTIVVRDLSKQSSAEMERRAGLLSIAPDTLLITNYFGAQRFGSARHKQGFVATRLIAGDFEGALQLAIATPARKDTGKTRRFTRLAAQHWGDWKKLAQELPRCPERAPIEALASGEEPREAFTRLPAFLQQMYVEAYQSHLWNETVRRFVRMSARPTPENDRGDVAETQASDTPGLIHSTDAFGEMLFPAAAAVPPEHAALEIPVLCAKSELIEPWRPAAAQALVAEGVELSSLRIPGLRRPFFGEAMRPVFVRAASFRIGAPEPDELSNARRRMKRTVEFDLPRGSYATVVLRALGQ